ncbi:MAG TPA: hypothetical protein VN698_05075, partial [Bacteroidia bacterium]|nr:hypothetical protein [Bacteroidia bacterium]
MSRLLTACQLVAKAMSISLAPLPEYLTDKKIEEIAQAGKFRVRQVNLSGNWWNYDNGPLLVFNKKGQQAYALLLSPNSTYQLV